MVIVWAFLTGFTHWYTKNMQDSLSEAFARKRATNDFIVKYEKDLAALVSGATNAEEEDLREDLIFKEDLHTNLIFKSRPDAIDHSAHPDPANWGSFVQRMFVFQELDNLEFVWNKFRTDLIDKDQMLRACEIFESRCLNDQFRRAACGLGKNNYDVDFLKLVDNLAIYGFVLSPAFKSSPAFKLLQVGKLDADAASNKPSPNSKSQNGD